MATKKTFKHSGDESQSTQQRQLRKCFPFNFTMRISYTSSTASKRTVISKSELLTRSESRTIAVAMRRTSPAPTAMMIVACFFASSSSPHCEQRKKHQAVHSSRSNAERNSQQRNRNKLQQRKLTAHASNMQTHRIANAVVLEERQIAARTVCEKQSQ